MKVLPHIYLAVMLSTGVQASVPFNDVRFVPPCVIEMEQYDRGGYSGDAIWDTTTANVGGKFRDDYNLPWGGSSETPSADIGTCDDLGGGYAVQYTTTPEYLVYSIYVPVAGSFDIGVRCKGMWYSYTPAFTLTFEPESGANIVLSGPSYFSAQNWTTVHVGAANLTPGNYRMRVSFNATYDEYYRNLRYNYIRLIPSMTALQFAGVQRTVQGLSSDLTEAAGNNNRIVIQNVINSCNAGDTVVLPLGTWRIRQATPDDTSSWSGEANAALRIWGASRIRLTSAAGGKATLVADNRATTLLYVGGQTHYTGEVLVDNIIFQARPDVIVSNPAYGMRWVNGGSLGSTLLLFGSATSPLNKVQVQNCDFINPANVAIFLGYGQEYLFQGNNFYNYANGLSTIWQNNLGIFDGGFNITNVVVRSNYFNGNCGMTTPNDIAADGLVWLSMGGNWAAISNRIENFGLEGIQFCAGPGAIAENVFSSIGIAAAAFVGYNNTTGDNDPSSAISIFTSFTFVNNLVSGCLSGCQAYPPSILTCNSPFDIHCSGNKFNMNAAAPPNNSVGAVTVGNMRMASVAGNTVLQAHRGVQTWNSSANAPLTTAVIYMRCNDFKNVTWNSFFVQEQVEAVDYVYSVADQLGTSNGGYQLYNNSTLTAPTCDFWGSHCYYWQGGLLMDDGISAPFHNFSNPIYFSTNRAGLF